MSDKSIQTLIVVLPAYNEEARIGETIKALKEITPRLAEQSVAMKIFVINDGSEDNTESEATKAGADRIVKHHVNMGLGAAVRTGMTAARDAGADIIVKFDADLQHDPKDIPDLIRPILDEESDVVYGNRHPRISYKMPFIRKWGNRFFVSLMRMLLNWPIEDSQPGIFAINRRYFVNFFLPGNYNYTQQILIDAYHKGMRFSHVPVAFRKRETGKSFISLKYPFKVLGQIAFLLIATKPLRVFGTIGVLFLAVGTAVFFADLYQWAFHAAEKPVVHANAVLGFSLFGLQTLFFGIIAELLVNMNSR